MSIYSYPDIFIKNIFVYECNVLTILRSYINGLNITSLLIVSALHSGALVDQVPQTRIWFHCLYRRMFTIASPENIKLLFSRKECRFGPIYHPNMCIRKHIHCSTVKVFFVSANSKENDKLWWYTQIGRATTITGPSTNN